MSFKVQLTDFLSSKYSIKIAETDSLLDAGLIDSIDLLDIISFIENSTGVRIQETEIVPTNFETIANIDALVCRLNGAEVREPANAL